MQITTALCRYFAVVFVCLAYLTIVFLFDVQNYMVDVCPVCVSNIFLVVSLCLHLFVCKMSHDYFVQYNIDVCCSMSMHDFLIPFCIFLSIQKRVYKNVAIFLFDRGKLSLIWGSYVKHEIKMSVGKHLTHQPSIQQLNYKTIEVRIKKSCSYWKQKFN